MILEIVGVLMTVTVQLLLDLARQGLHNHQTHHQYTHLMQMSPCKLKKKIYNEQITLIKVSFVVID